MAGFELCCPVLVNALDIKHFAYKVCQRVGPVLENPTGKISVSAKLPHQATTHTTSATPVHRGNGQRVWHVVFTCSMQVFNIVKTGVPTQPSIPSSQTAPPLDYLRRVKSLSPKQRHKYVGPVEATHCEC
ncbi:hypothetical protein E2C01_036951 [Portunus trituberculatus]|uniref:Uncharacterized protein n=1 Tax=Portunus trituberculatus TaxID=210409 RepID=A0A5B7FCM4_PORTR|nr:hypothetical protein [Portunus trituberculatus]